MSRSDLLGAYAVSLKPHIDPKNRSTVAEYLNFCERRIATVTPRRSPRSNKKSRRGSPFSLRFVLHVRHKEQSQDCCGRTFDFTARPASTRCALLMAFATASPLPTRLRDTRVGVQGARRFPLVAISNRRRTSSQSPSPIPASYQSSSLIHVRTTTDGERRKRKQTARQTSSQGVQDLFVSDVEDVVAGFSLAPSARNMSAKSTLTPSRIGCPPGVNVRSPSKLRVSTGRKPNGYWNELSNVEAALVEVNKQIIGRRGKRIMPSTAQMRDLGRLDLLAALSKHKGLKRVAEVLGWQYSRRKSSQDSVANSDARTANSRNAARPTTYQISDSQSFISESVSSSQSQEDLGTIARHPLQEPLSYDHDVFSSRPQRFSRIRPKVLRRPKSYWDDISAVKSSISAFILEYGTPGVMPTEREFAKANQSALRLAAQRHGGLAVVAEQMGLEFRPPPGRRGKWKEFDYFSRALLDYVQQHDAGVMPTASELKAGGEYQLCTAVTYHGGFPEVARRLGLIVRNARKEGAPRTWDREKLSSQLRTFTATFFPALALSNCLPSEAQLRKCGRNDLCYAISKFGGYKRVQEQLGFASRPVGPRSVIL